MKYLFLGLLVSLLQVSPASAYELFETKVDEPYTIIEIGSDIESPQVHLGELDNFPIMYGFEVTSTTSLALSLRQIYYKKGDPLPIGIILVKEDKDKRGVSEIVRFNPKSEKWLITEDSSLGLTFWDTEPLTKELLPGIYRLEVSTPENLAKYALHFGPVSESNSGYFKSLGQIRKTQEFFGYSIFRMLSSPLVYYPIGIILLIFAFKMTSKYRRRIFHAS